MFTGNPAEWTANQIRLVRITREYNATFSALGMRGHDLPSQQVLMDYRRFREWWDEYVKDPNLLGDNPYKRYGQGFSVR